MPVGAYDNDHAAVDDFNMPDARVPIVTAFKGSERLPKIDAEVFSSISVAE